MAISKFDTKKKVDILQEEIERRDAKLRQLQQTLEAAMSDKQQFEQELQRVKGMSDSPAGKKLASA